MGKRTWPGEGTKIPAAAQVGRGVDLRRLAKVWVSAWDEFGSRASTVATIAAALWLAPHLAIPAMALAWGVMLGGILQLLLQLAARLTNHRDNHV